MKPAISVIITTFNRAGLLGRAIDSVLRQTISDFELLVIDDGSTDETANVVREYAGRDSRIRYLPQSNQGLSASRSRGLQLAQGEFIAFLDDDDVYYPDKLKIQSDFLKENSGFAMVYSQVMIVRNGVDDGLYPEKPAVNFEELLRGCSIQPNAVMLRRAQALSVGTFDGSLKGHDDYDFWLRLSHAFPISFLPVPVGTYNVHGANMSGNMEARYEDLYLIFSKFRGKALGPSARAILKESIGTYAYRGADLHMHKGNYFKAARFYLRAVRHCPAVGLSIGWSKFNNSFYRYLKPYLAAGYCVLKGVSRSFQKTVRV